jgi:hypothetical protein
MMDNIAAYISTEYAHHYRHQFLDAETMNLFQMSALLEFPPDYRNVTDYDRMHFLTYARFLDAETKVQFWHRSVAEILSVDAAQDIRLAYKL